jgi:hypothetical protein
VMGRRGVIALLAGGLLLSACGTGSPNATALSSPRIVDGIEIQLPQHWRIIDRGACASDTSSVIVNTVPYWLSMQACPSEPNVFKTTIRIGHFGFIKSYEGTLTRTREVNGIRVDEDYLPATRLILDVYIPRCKTSIDFAYSPFRLPAKDVTVDRTLANSVIASIHLSR